MINNKIDMKYYPLVTIIIPVYNGSNYLEEAIKSAINQTYKNLEIIVVNDGSNDNGETEKIALSFSHKIKYFNKTNNGVSSALNYGIKQMNGEWFSWLSHDDLYYPNKILKQVEVINFIINKGDINNDFKLTIRSATESIDSNGKVLRRPNYKNVPFIESAIDTFINNIYDYKLSGCSFLIPKKSIKDIGFFDENIKTVSDVDFWYRLLLDDYKFYCISNEILVKNRSHGQQVGKLRNKEFEDEINELHYSLIKKIKSNEKFDDKHILKKIYFGLSYRKLTRAKIYLKAEILKSKISTFDYYIKIPLVDIIYSIKGSFRLMFRYFYRKVKVKKLHQ